MHMGACEEVWFRWVETNTLNNTLRIIKRPSRVTSSNAMNHYLATCLNIVG